MKTLFFIMVAMVLPVVAGASTCRQKTFVEAFEEAEVVFIGSVDKVNNVDVPMPPEHGQRAIVAFGNVIYLKGKMNKGEDSSRTEILYTFNGGGRAPKGYPFEKKKKYVVFARWGKKETWIGKIQPVALPPDAEVPDEILGASFCSGTKPFGFTALP